jgi:exosortase
LTLANHNYRRWLLFCLWLIASVAISWRVLASLLNYSLGNDDASHILLIPFISAWLLFLDRRRIFSHLSSDIALSIPLAILGLLSVMWSSPARLESHSLTALGLVLLWIAGFALAFGWEATKIARFPLLFLFLFIPLPEALLGRVIYFLQRGSTEVTALFFSLTPVPVLREGFVFHLPRFSIEVARECSGIRSSIALLVLAILTGHLLLKSFWRQTVLVLAGIVVMIIKNGIRIVTLTLLANYVDPGFLYGNLHREGGVVFFMVGLLLLVPVLWFLQRGESRDDSRAIKVPAEAV